MLRAKRLSVSEHARLRAFVHSVVKYADPAARMGSQIVLGLAKASLFSARRDFDFEHLGVAILCAKADGSMRL